MASQAFLIASEPILGRYSRALAIVLAYIHDSKPYVVQPSAFIHAIV